MTGVIDDLANFSCPFYYAGSEGHVDRTATTSHLGRI